MQKLKNKGEVIEQLKPLLRQYLEEQENIVFKSSNFTCPNYQQHGGEDDRRPSAGFIPDNDETIWNCFACSANGTIFDAVHYLEGKEIKGSSFYKIVKYVADKYKIEYELEELSEKEKEFNTVQQFLQTLINSAHKYLKEKKPKEAMKYLKKRNWINSIDKFQIGYLPDNPKIKKFFIKAFKEHPEIKNYISIADNQITGRIIYPIKHRYGTILGLIHRTIDDSTDGPKYQKHLLKTLDKNGMLFNLTNIHQEVYVVEGGSSVITLSNEGIPNVVSSLGARFTSQMYNSLVKSNVKKAIFVYERDNAGLGCIENMIKTTQNKSDIKIVIKVLPETKDPDDIIMESGIEEFKKLPEVSSFKYQLTKLKEDEDNLEVKTSIYEMILVQEDTLLQDKMIKYFSKEFEILKSLIVEELRKYEVKHGIKSSLGVNTSDLLYEKTALLQDVDKFEEKAWRVDGLLGPSTGFPILDSKLDGLQDGFHVISGKWNMGKSAFMISLALNLLKDPNNYVLYFSIDDSIITKTIPRMVANISCIPINTVANPMWRIQKNETMTEIEKINIAEKREKAIELLKSLTSRLGLKDATHGYDVDFVEKMVKIYSIIAGERKLVIFIDFMNMIQYHNLKDRIEIETKLAETLKHLSGLYNIPVVATAESTKNISDKGMKDTDVKGSSSIHFKADTIMLIWSDFDENSKNSDMYFYDEEGKAFPIVELKLAKNKISGYKGSVYFKFFTTYSKFEELDESGQKKFWRGK